MAANVCAEKILHIGKDSSLLMSLTPAMVLHMMRIVRCSKDILTLPDAKREHICELAIEYTKHHHADLDAMYFEILISDLYFPDDTSLAGKVAIGVLEIIELAGWEKDIDGNIKGVCTAILSKHLRLVDLNAQLTNQLRLVPKSVMVSLLTNALDAKRAPDRRIDLQCKIMSTHFDGSTITILGVEYSDSIDYVRYLVSREINIMPYHIRVGGKELAGDTLVSCASISPDTILEMRAHGYLVSNHLVDPFALVE